MNWMRRDEDFSSLTNGYFKGHLAGFVCWVLAGIGVIVGMSALGASAWVLACSVLVWCGALLLWLQRDVAHFISSRANLTPSNKGGQSEPVWQSWVSGWYWQTDASHRIQVLKPGLNIDHSDSTNWSGVAELLSQTPVWFDCWAAESTSDGALSHLRFVMQQKQGLAEPVRLPRPAWLSSQTGGWCEIKAQPLWDGAGQFVGFHGVISIPPDDKPKSEASSSQASSSGESEPGDTVIPSPMTEGDQEVLRYALSHDLRAPLRVVEGFARIVKEDYSKVLDRMGVDHLDRVLAAAARMNGMIDAILAQAQLAGAPLLRESIDVSALVHDIADDLASVTPAANVATFLVAPGMSVEADPILVRRVLENLVGNALKYSAKVAEPLIEVGVMPATNPSVFFVRDNGAGFDMQHANKLFGLFQRLHSAKEFPGTGVGLAGVHNIIRRHGGQVWAEASPGKGACFYFTLMGTAEAQQRAGRQAA